MRNSVNIIVSDSELHVCTSQDLTWDYFMEPDSSIAGLGIILS